MLIDQIKAANVKAMKERNANARAVFSILITRYQTLLTSGNGEVSDADVSRMIQKLAKELDEEHDGYVKVGNAEQAQLINEQKTYVLDFLPKMLSEDEIKNIIVGLPDKSIPSVMKHFKTNYDGKVDMALVSKVARGL